MRFSKAHFFKYLPKCKIVIYQAYQKKNTTIWDKKEIRFVFDWRFSFPVWREK